MRTRKIILSTILSILVLVQAAQLGLGGDVTICSLHLVFALYLLGIAISSVSRQTVSTHTESVWHLAPLTAFSVALMGFTSILPAKDLPVIASHLRVSIDILPTLWYISFVVYILAVATAVTIPCGPGLHYPPTSIYSEKTAQAITNKDRNNVSGYYGSYSETQFARLLLITSIQAPPHGTFSSSPTPPKS